MAATTTLLGLVTPTQGTLSGTWGDTVNYGISDYVDISVAGTLTLTNDGAVTLANTTGSSSGNSITSSLTGAGTVTAQFAIVRVTGTLTTAKVVTGPSYSKTYTVVNAATGGIVTFKAAGQTGVSVAVGETAFVYFNGTDYVKIVGTATAGAAGGSNTQVQFNSSGILAGSANMTFNGTILTAAGFSGPLNGTVGATTPAAGTFTQVDITAQGTLRLQDTTGGEYVALRAPASLAGNYTLTFPADDGTSGQALITDGSGVLSWSTAASGDVYGPGSSTDNAIARFDSTTGKLIQNSVVIVSDTGAVTGVTNLSASSTVGVGDFAAAPETGLNVRFIGSLTSADISGVSSSISAPATASSTTKNYYSSIRTTATSGSRGFIYNFYAEAPSIGATSTASTIYGFYASNQGNAGINNAYGVYIEAQSGSPTTNVGLRNEGTSILVGSTTIQTLTVGLGAGAVASNTAVGASALAATATGVRNTGIGASSLNAVTSGAENTAVGYYSLVLNSTGSYNTALGDQSLQGNTTASNNTAVGYASLFTNSTGTSNTAVGFQSLASNTTANSNTAVGYQAGYTNSTGAGNTFVGYQAGLLASTSNGQTFIGQGAGAAKTTGGNNTFVGTSAGGSATTGTGNTFIGVNDATNGSGFAVTSGSKNTIIGGYTGSAAPISLTGSNFVVLSDGDGNIVASAKTAQTFALQGAVPNSGTGITFPATQSASSNENTLDDYEEGYWFPVLTPASGTITVASGNTKGAYTKVGRLVTVTGNAGYTSSAASGAITLSGLPFAVNTSLEETSERFSGGVFLNGFTTGDGYGSVLIDSGTSGSLRTSISTNPVPDASFEIYISFSYFTT